MVNRMHAHTYMKLDGIFFCITAAAATAVVVVVNAIPSKSRDKMALIPWGCIASTH